MSFKLKELARIYEREDSDGSEFSRGHGVEILIAFFTCLGISDPEVSDLSVNILKAWERHVRDGSPEPVAYSYVSDVQLFLIFISSDHGYSSIDYTGVLLPADELQNVIRLPFPLRRKPQ
jgi:hypothetical protein